MVPPEKLIELWWLLEGRISGGNMVGYNKGSAWNRVMNN